MRGLWKGMYPHISSIQSCFDDFAGSYSIYILMLVYGASTATTTLPCLSVLFTTPITSVQTIAAGVQSITVFQRFLLLSSYLPFFLLPLFMTLDMAVRITKLVQAGVEVTAGKKFQ